MENNNLHTALILFTRAAEEEAQYKNILPSHAYPQQKTVFEYLNQSAEAVLAATGLPYFVISAQEQSGNHFGERLYDALEKVFRQGFAQVLVIGNDCPQLKPADITQATQLFTRHEVILGPCTNGGIYLLGITYRQFKTVPHLNHIPWHTGRVFANLKSYFENKTVPVACLARYADVNNKQDLQQLFRLRVFRKPLHAFISRVIGSSLRPVFYYFKPDRVIYLVQHILFRGPPALN